MRLKDPVAVITGAASGIGLEIARTFVGEGARVAIADVDAGAAASAAMQLCAGDPRHDGRHARRTG